MNILVYSKRVNGGAAYLKVVYSDTCNRMFYYLIPVVEYCDNDGNIHRDILKYPIYSNSVYAENLEQASNLAAIIDNDIYTIKKSDRYCLYIVESRHAAVVRQWMVADDYNNCVYIYGGDDRECIFIVNITNDNTATVTDQYNNIELVARIKQFKE